jgi:hypothetical protein
VSITTFTPAIPGGSDLLAHLETVFFGGMISSRIRSGRNEALPQAPPASLATAT